MTPREFKRRRARLFPAPSQQKSRALAAAAFGVTIRTVQYWEEKMVPQSAANHIKLLGDYQDLVTILTVILVAQKCFVAAKQHG